MGYMRTQEGVDLLIAFLAYTYPYKRKLSKSRRTTKAAENR